MKTYSVIGIAMMAALSATAKDCSVDVYVVSVVSKPVGPLVYSARSKVTAMFREIGVTVRMRDGNPRPDASSPCGAPIVIRIEDSTGYDGPADALAHAMPYQAGTLIHLFLDRVARKSNQPAFLMALLAHVMAHEIGHVLQQIARHSDEGMMKANWSGKDYQAMERKTLPFAPIDVEFIRDGLAKRFNHAAGE